MSGDSLNQEESAEALPGYFGKMPARGDFLSRGLPRDFIDPWDDWIQVSIEQSRTRLGGQWLDTYLTSPLWCFALAPSICGPHPWAGVLMPSVDAVGRYFPLTIAAPLELDSNVFAISSEAHGWFSQLDALARSCLVDEFDLAAFDEALSRLGTPRGRSAPAALEDLGADTGRLINAWRYGMSGPDQAKLDCPTLMHAALDRLLFSYSLWWTTGSARVTPSYLICQGLPPPQGYAAMLDGSWQKWGWDDRHVIESGQAVDSVGPDTG